MVPHLLDRGQGAADGFRALALALPGQAHNKAPGRGHVHKALHGAVAPAAARVRVAGLVAMQRHAVQHLAPRPQPPGLCVCLQRADDSAHSAMTHLIVAKQCFTLHLQERGLQWPKSSVTTFQPATFLSAIPGCSQEE